MHFRYLLLLLFLMLNLFGFAQNVLNSVRQQMKLFNYANAVEILVKEVSKNDGRTKCEATQLLADCYRMQNNVAKAKEWYEKAMEIEDQCRFVKKTGTEIYLYYGEALRSSMEYERAKRYFQKYDSLTPGQHHGALLSAYCDSAIRWQTRKPEFQIRNMTRLNTPQSEFGTVFYIHGIIFASDRVSKEKEEKAYGWTGNNYLNLYFAEEENPDNSIPEYSTPRLSPGLPNQEWHDGPVTFSSDFSKLYFTRTQLNHDKGKKDPGSIRTHLLKIFFSSLEGGQWTTPEPFAFNSDQYSVGHPALSKDGKTLLFASDMPGGYGETDIWYCIREADHWSEPLNAGPRINSQGKEMFPFIAASGDLYYASDGLPGFGGLDLFASHKIDNQWTTPQNLGWPINSSYDDLSLIISEKEMFGLFSSNRPGGSGSDDIYGFSKIPSRIDSISPPLISKSADSIKTPAASYVDTLKMNKSYRLENILYDFDKWDIRADATPALDKLVVIMKEHPISIELGSHTDCRGSDIYNMELSQKRAESAVQYILARGISASRITAMGYGKSQLLNQCNCEAANKCSEAEHQFNRRTEFRITGLTTK